ncbi:hypothetical protein AMATHDRAFT_7446 [Amanita thiersii Skay4041]|uniref:Protein kinase domain-containing protein n=1 Tax=Amanita thiersii Skay4041 TaxID=703135 RepID=A0A2A9NGA8_9AGAR|nr:hypothetical protein AMATHDRAFT_7446 [Amanita thiersii Skay4041]
MSQSRPSNFPPSLSSGSGQRNAPPSAAPLSSPAVADSRKSTPVSSISSSRSLGAGDKVHVRIWARCIQQNNHICENVDEFLEKYVPGEKPTDGDLLKYPSGLFKEHFTCDGKVEDCEGMAMALNNLMEVFPSNRRITFANTRTITYDLDNHSEHKIRPDISGTYPGQNIPNEWSWDLCPIAIELKKGYRQDPIEADGRFKLGYIHDKTLAQIAKIGHNILAGTRACFSFVIGVYQNYARIYRFDHAAVVISPSFDLFTTDALIQFFHRLVHPSIVDMPHGTPSTAPLLLGLDRTIMTLSDQEKVWVKETLISCHGYPPEQAESRANSSQRVLASFSPLDIPYNKPISEAAKITWCYTIGDPLWSSDGLFSRATHVWKVLFKEDEQHFYALKDSWRHAYRDAEIKVYEHVRCRYEEYPTGLARAVGGLDLGDIEGFTEHRTNSCDAAEGSGEEKESEPEHEHDCGDDNQNVDKDEDENGVESGSENDNNNNYTHEIKGKDNSEDWEDDETLDSEFDELPGQVLYDLNRMHCRITLYPVGVPLVLFPSTKHLVSALEYSIKGHQALFECGLLHRDISPHNILLIEGEGLRGFLHDLDYCTYVKEWDKFASDNDDPASNFGHLRSHTPESLRDMTGTYQFMAIEVLEQQPHRRKDDLESFIWVLFWLVLRHMDYFKTDWTCAEVFDELDPLKAAQVKKGFLMNQPKYNRYVRVRHNQPLSTLLRELVGRILNVDPLSHLNVLPLFESALNMSPWPKKDTAKPFIAEKSEYETGSVQPKLRSSAPKRPAPSDSKAKQQQNKRRKGSPSGLSRIAHVQPRK